MSQSGDAPAEVPAADPAATPQNAPISRVVLAKEPERFNGTKSDFRSFFFSLKLYFQANPSSFAHRNSKILYTFSCFTGRAAVWSENYTTDHTDAETAEIAFSPITDYVEMRMQVQDHSERIPLGVADLGNTDILIGHD